MNDGDYEYLGLEVGSDGEVIEFQTLSTRQSSSSPNVGQVPENRSIHRKYFYIEQLKMRNFTPLATNFREKNRDFDDFEKKRKAALSTRHVAGPGEALMM